MSKQDVANDSKAARLRERFQDAVSDCAVAFGEISLTVPPGNLLTVARSLRDEPDFKFEMLIDLAGVDYLAYGIDEWATDEATNQGFSRGVEEASFGRFSFKDAPPPLKHAGPRFAVAYHLLSISRNERLRLKVYCEDDDAPVVDSITDVWASADWFEREAFDLYGILFDGHPDLRRILTDYGFMGHPFRKDFPLIGNVEMRYDPEQGRVIYQPVTIEPRVLVPKVIRDDHRYIDQVAQEKPPGA
ncbi:MAG: NADH-quinone oxidoreductase subunit C [Pseudomonadota bacterium]|nr:NADH-quinone oxidoreductase subunit C [Pseudomonadota bacterium]